MAVPMEDMLLKIIDALREEDVADDASGFQVPNELLFSRLIDRLGKGRPDAQDYSKEKLLPYYQAVKRDDKARWQLWDIDPALEKRFLRVMQVKPRRSASGVATITVITKPWKCGSDCLYCPNDVRMPKSYLSDEPACQRAERNFFDPYLQVQARLCALIRMGHLTDKIEVIVLGGSWCDYPPEYQLWFTRELYRALNAGEEGWQEAERIRQDHLDAGMSSEKELLIARSRGVQERVNQGELTYNQAIEKLRGQDGHWRLLAEMPSGKRCDERCGEEECAEAVDAAGINVEAHTSSSVCATSGKDSDSNDFAVMDALRNSLYREQWVNESSAHRMVGFTVETRPDLVNVGTLVLMRQLGVTRLQIGIQSLDPQVLKLNNRKVTLEQIRTTFALARIMGFKIHAHFMQNLYGSSLSKDKAEYKEFMTDPAYQPDEIKLYPCSLVEGTGLCAHFKDGSWQPYSEQELIELLAADTLNTPAFTRISRMIRDISSHDIIAGSKRTNLRQLVEKYIEDTGGTIKEIRYREISNREVIVDDLHLDIITYDTTVSTEHFLQWITPDYRIAGFLRLSLPTAEGVEYLSQHTDRKQEPPINPNEAMIREVHVYGKVAAIGKLDGSVQRKQNEPDDVKQSSLSEVQFRALQSKVQHLGLGRKLIEKACKMAGEAGYTKINVISSVGTREYYRKLNFKNATLYQVRDL